MSVNAHGVDYVTFVDTLAFLTIYMCEVVDYVNA